MENEAGKCARGWGGRGAELPAHPEWAAVSSRSHSAHGAALLEGIRKHWSFCWQKRGSGIKMHLCSVGLGIKSEVWLSKLKEYVMLGLNEGNG